MHAPAQDLRFAFRQLWKAPGFTLTVVFTLALGVGAVSAIFSLVEGILLRPLPFNNPDRLVMLGDRLEGGSSGTPVTAREIATYSTATNAFSSLGGYISSSYELSSGATPEQINAARFTAGVFPTLGVQPMLGRVFTQQEEDAHEPVAVITYSLWLQRYHHDSHILGSSIVLDRRPYSIIGVMPPSFEFPLESGHLDQAQLWVPMSLTANELSDEHGGFWGYQMVARLKEGITLTQAAQDADRVSRQIMQNATAAQRPIHIHGTVTQLLEYDVAEARPLLLSFFLAVLVVLLIACANAAVLLLVRAIRRRSEYAVRLALGATSSAVIRESVFEGMLFGTAGGVLGLALAAIAIRITLHLLPDSMPRISSVSMDGTVAVFALLLALGTGAVCSLAPAFAALRTSLTDILNEGSRTGTGAASHAWLRSGLVVAEIAIALVLLNTSIAFLRSFQRMRAVDPGFRPEHVLVAGYQLPLKQYSSRTSADNFNHAVMDKLLSKPGTAGVGIGSSIPAVGNLGESGYTIEDEPTATWKLKFAAFTTTYGDYFRALDIALIDGRYFTDDDRSNSQPVVIVSQSMARNSWPGQRAIGKRMHIGSPQNKMPWATVVGVVSDTKLGSRDEPSIDQWYTPAQQPSTLYGSQITDQLTDPPSEYLVLRSSLPPEQMINTLRSTVSDLDPLLALQQVQPLTDAISSVETPRRFNTDLITAFAAGALLLAITGIYAVVAFSVLSRTQELAIRIALGSSRIRIARLVLISGVRLALFGCILGLLASLAVSRVVSSFLFEVSATDPFIYAASALIMTLIAIVASTLPARRATFADPVSILHST